MSEYFCVFTTTGILNYNKGTKPPYINNLIASLDPRKTAQYRKIQDNHMFCEFIKKGTIALSILKHNDKMIFKKELEQFLNKDKVPEVKQIKKEKKSKDQKGRKWEEKIVDDPSLDFSEQNDQQVRKIEEVKKKQKSYSFNLFKKVINKEELKQKMMDHLVGKNVNVEITKKIIDDVIEDFGEKIHEKEFKEKIKNVIKKMIHGINHDELIKKIKSNKEIYKICFVGVNGVGKSTSLAKICCWLLQNGLKVYIAACDTFRAGAIEQLKVHVDAFKRSGHDVGFLEKGYNKDDSSVAKSAINIAGKENYDVILIDTAGRMHNKQNLMDSLSKLIRVNDIDHIIFVGEALVGNDSLEHLIEFNKAIGRGREGRNIDSIFVSKADTVEDKIGQVLNMCVSGECPVLFVGTGQTNTSLEKLNTDKIVDYLMN